MMRTTSMKIIGQDANGKNMCVCHFECDSAADLPAYNVYQSDGYVFVLSSTAHTIDTDKKYELTSTGTWIEQSQPWQPLADYSVLANKPQINGHTLAGNQSGADLGLQNTLTFDSTPTQNSANPVTSGGIWTDQQRQDSLQIEDRDALIELVDSGAKNHALENDKTGTRAFEIDVRPITGTYRLVIGQYTSTDTDTNNFAIIFDYSDGTNEIRYYHKNADINYEYTTNKYLNRIHIYASFHYVQSDGDTVSVSNLMICTAAAYAISPAFVPYRPSWQEMYNMILASQ